MSAASSWVLKGRGHMLSHPLLLPTGWSSDPVMVRIRSIQMKSPPRNSGINRIAGAWLPAPTSTHQPDTAYTCNITTVRGENEHT